MSEYQYFDFLAIDRPLTAQEMDHLRGISTRAKITPVSFVNEYHWGGLKADPRDFMRRFFDVHVFLANWGEAVLMVRLPKEAMDGKALKAFMFSPYLEYEKLPGHWLLTWSLGEAGDYDRFCCDEETSWMARLAPLREELLRGDLRSLYIGWLGGVTAEGMDEDDREPLALNGLGELTAAQQALAEFLEVDGDLLAGAGIGSPKLHREQFDETRLDVWLDDLPREEVRGYLRQMLAGQGAQAERALRRRHAAWQSKSSPVEQGEPRTVAQLMQQVAQARSLRLIEEAEARRQAEAEQKKRREAWLATLAKDFPKAWRSAHAEASRGHASAYDAACRQLVDLRDAYSMHASPAAFQKEFQRFMAEHRRRRALVQRLVKAGLLRALL